MSQPPIEPPVIIAPPEGPFRYLNVRANDKLITGVSTSGQKEIATPTFVLATDAQIAAIQQPGMHYLETNGTIRTEPYPPPPLKRYDGKIFVKEAKTTNGTPAVVTFPIADNTGYIGTMYVLGVQDISPFNRASARKAFMVARRTGNAILDGQADLHPPFQRGASTWTVVLAVAGSDVTVTLTGAPGINIDWTLWGEFFRFSKEGLVD